MRYAVGLLAFLLASIAAAQSGADMDEQNGFRDAKFGMKPEELPGLELKRESGDFRHYRRPSDKLAIGPVELLTVEYGFYKGRLGQITIRFSGADFPTMFEAFQARFGAPQLGSKAKNEFVWSGEAVRMSIETAESGMSTLSIWHIPLARIWNEASKTAEEEKRRSDAEAAAKDF